MINPLYNYITITIYLYLTFNLCRYYFQTHIAFTLFRFNGIIRSPTRLALRQQAPQPSHELSGAP